MSVPYATPTVTRMRRLVVGREWLTTSAVMSALFGTMIVTSSRVMMCVARRPMSSTVPERAADANEVAVTHRLLEQEDDAADEVLRDVLQAEADADGQDRGRREERVEPEAHRIDGPNEADRGHRVADDLRDRELHALRGTARTEHAAHREREKIGDGKRDEHDRRADEERPGRDRRARPDRAACGRETP